jgi:hypothetical protein
VTAVQKHLHSLRIGYTDAYNETLNNSEDLSYTGNAFMGTPLQGSTSDLYVYDTGSGYLTVSAADCLNCYDFIYDPSASNTTGSCSDFDNTALYYGSTTLYGGMVADNVCLSNNSTYNDTCVTDFCFFLIDEEYGLNSDAGILGLGPPFSKNGPSFFGTLIEQQGEGSFQPVTSWHLSQLPNESWVDFGAID